MVEVTKNRMLLNRVKNRLGKICPNRFPTVGLATKLLRC